MKKLFTEFDLKEEISCTTSIALTTALVMGNLKSHSTSSFLAPPFRNLFHPYAIRSSSYLSIVSLEINLMG